MKLKFSRVAILAAASLATQLAHSQGKDLSKEPEIECYANNDYIAQIAFNFRKKHEVSHTDKDAFIRSGLLLARYEYLIEEKYEKKMKVSKGTIESAQQRAIKRAEDELSEAVWKTNAPSTAQEAVDSSLAFLYKRNSKLKCTR